MTYIGVVSSLIANGLTALVSCGIKEVKNARRSRDAICKALQADTILISSIRDITKKVVVSSNEIQSTMIQLFLESPTAESIVRQMYSDFLQEELRPKNTEQLREEFQICLAYHLGVNKCVAEQLADGLFEVISTGCRRALDLAVNQGILSAHEAKSIQRHKVLLDEIRAIRSNLDFLSKNSHLDMVSIREFERKYRSQVAQRSSKILIPHFDRAPRIDIDKIFISPNFIRSPEKQEAEGKTVSLDDFLARLYRAVVLGDPGGGKSTLAQKICYELSKNLEKRIVGGRLLTPVPVILREYSSQKKKDGRSIIQFMESEANSKYQIPEKVPFGAFEYLLNNGHILVIFDGLDELLDPGHRREISQDIESFCNLFPSVPVLVTSRVVGYEQAPLDSECFEKFQIASFNNEQVSDYVAKWFNNDPDLSLDERERRVRTFLKESEIVSDLRSNPLMLALMCNLYRGAGFIPKNRPEVYKKCSEMLFERWDPSRGIWVDLPITEPKVLLSHLAHWIYSDELLQSGATRDQLVQESTQFLLYRRFEVEEAAEKASREFIEFCRGRAWVFTDAGTTLEGKDLYKFTHKTFLEYFTAVYIVRNNNTPEKLWALLSSKIAERAWDVVAQLAFQMLHEQVEGGSDELLEMLIGTAQKKKGNCWQYLSFGARCLQFIHPSPKTIRSLTSASIKFVIEDSLLPRREPDLYSRGGRYRELMYSLLSAPPESRETIADSIENEVTEYSKSIDDKIAIQAIDLGLSLNYPGYGNSNEITMYWHSVRRRIFENVRSRLEVFAPHDFCMFMHLFREFELSAEKFFEWYSLNYLFLEQVHKIYYNWRWSPIATTILRSFQRLVESDDSENLWGKRAISILSGIGLVLPSTSFPCFSYELVSESFVHLPQITRIDFERPSLVGVSCDTFPISDEIIMGTWCLWAAIVEVAEEELDFSGETRFSNVYIPEVVLEIIRCRLFDTDISRALQNLKKFSISKNELEIVEKWMKKRLSLVSLPQKIKQRRSL